MAVVIGAHNVYQFTTRDDPIHGKPLAKQLRLGRLSYTKTPVKRQWQKTKKNKWNRRKDIVSALSIRQSVDNVNCSF